MVARHFVSDGDADSMTPTGLTPQHLRPASVTSERLAAVENANDRVEFLLTQLLMAEESARRELVTSVEQAEREQMAQILLDPVPDPDLEPDDVAPWMEDEPSAQAESTLQGESHDEADELLDEPAVPFDEPAEPLDEPAAPFDEPAVPLEGLGEPGKPLDEPTVPIDELGEPLDEPAAPAKPVSTRSERMPSIPEVAAVDEPSKDMRDRFSRPEVKVASSSGEVLATKERKERLDVGTSVMDDDASGRTRELSRRNLNAPKEGFFSTVGAFVARALHLD